MKAFKYLIFLIVIFTSTYSNAAKLYKVGGFTASSAAAACQQHASSVGLIYVGSEIVGSSFRCDLKNKNGSMFVATGVITTFSCPSATSKDLKVPVNSKSYVCVDGCQYRIRSCVDVDIEPGMTCSATSTGQDCGKNPPPKTPDPNNPTPDPATPDPADPNGPPSQNTANSESTSTSTSESTSTQTTNNNTTITNMTTNTTTNMTTNTIINLDKLEAVIKNMTGVLGSKLDAILGKIGGDGGSGGSGGSGGIGGNIDLTQTNKKIDENKSVLESIKDFLTGGDEGVPDSPFGNDAVPENVLTPQDLKTNIFGGSAACPADRTLSFQLFTGKTFSKSFSFAMWCDKLAIFGTLILIASYLYGAYIITSKS